jgi:hypothetical protein
LLVFLLTVVNGETDAGQASAEGLTGHGSFYGDEYLFLPLCRQEPHMAGVGTIITSHAFLRSIAAFRFIYTFLMR